MGIFNLQFCARVQRVFWSYQVLQAGLFFDISSLGVGRSPVIMKGVRRSLKLFLLAILTILIVSACSGTPSQDQVDGSATTSSALRSQVSECQVIQHDASETTICGQPQKVVALSPHMLDILLSFGVQPVGYAEVDVVLGSSLNFGSPMTQIKYLGNWVTSKPISVGTREQPSLEAISRLNPDLILGRLGQVDYALVSRISPTLLLDENKGGWQRGIQIVAKAFGREEQARRVIAAHKQVIAKARTDLAPVVESSPKVLLLSMSGLDSIKVFTEETFAGGLLKGIGFQLTSPEGLPVNSSDVNISLETLPQMDANIIIVMTSGKSSVEKIEKEWRQNTILRALPTSKTGRVYFVDYHLWSRIRGPIVAELVIDQIRELLLSSPRAD